jgi:pimeloyl-ACP methyl ester carboxylesterase
MASTSTTTAHLELGAGAVDLTYSDTRAEAATGPLHTVLLLHGGGGPFTVKDFADLLAERQSVRILVPSHPGFGGTTRPAWLDTPAGLAELYVALLDDLGLEDVTVIGNSVGGWIAAEIALRHSPRVGRLVIVDGTGIDVPGEPVADPFTISFEQLTQLSYHDPGRFGLDLSQLPEPVRAGVVANFAALRIYAPEMGDPTLRSRLAGVAVPTLVVWGQSDKVATPTYGRAFAQAIPGARFELLASTGHVPQIESPELLLEHLAAFTGAQPVA